MKIKVKFFGQMADVTGCDFLQFDDVENTDALIQKLQSKYPAFENSKYAVAVDKKIIQHNTNLLHNAEVAILPPFSGG